MADVPSWVVVFSTIAAAGAGLVPQFIDPKRDRQQRLATADEARRSLLLGKLEALFELMDAASASLSNMLLAEGDRLLTPGARVLLAPDLLTRLDKWHAVVATYFPAQLWILSDVKESLKPAVGEWTERVRSGGGDAHEAYKLTSTVVIVQGNALTKLRAALYEIAATFAGR